MTLPSSRVSLFHNGLFTKTMEQNAFSVGTRVDCLYEENTDKVWYPGLIAAVKVTECDACVYEIQYDDGEVEHEVVQEYIRVHEYGTICCGTRVAGNYASSGDWYTGTISEVQNDGRYTIRYDDGEMEGDVTLERIREIDDKSLEEEQDEGKVEENMEQTNMEEEMAHTDFNLPEFAESGIGTADNFSTEPAVPASTNMSVPVSLLEPNEPSELCGTIAPCQVTIPDTLGSHSKSLDDIHDLYSNRDDISPDKIPHEVSSASETTEFHPPVVSNNDPSNGPTMSHSQSQLSATEPVQPYSAGIEARELPNDVKEHLISCLQQLHGHSVDVPTTKSLVSHVVQYSRAYPHATADILHSCNGASLLLALLVANGSQAIVLCYCLVLLRRFCFLRPSIIEYFIQNDIVPSILYTMASFPDDAIVQASASGAIAAFLGPISCDIHRLETLLDLIFKSLYHHKTYSIHTRQVYFHSSQVLIELSQLEGNESIACLIWVKVCQKTNKLLDSIPFILMILYLKQALPAQDHKTIGTVGRFLVYIVTKYSHAVRLLQYNDGMNVLSAVLAILNEEEGMQQSVAAALDAITLAKKQSSWSNSGAEMGYSPSKTSTQAHSMRPANTRSSGVNPPSSQSLFPAAFPQSSGQCPTRVKWDSSWNISRKASDSMRTKSDKVSKKHPSCMKQERQRLLMATYGVPQKDKLDSKRKRSEYSSNALPASRSRLQKGISKSQALTDSHTRNSVTKNQRLKVPQNDIKVKQIARTLSQKPQLNLTSSSQHLKTTKARGHNKRSESLSHDSDSLSQYAKDLFREQQSSLSKERLSFAEKLHRMIDRAQSTETTKFSRQQSRAIPPKRPAPRSNTTETKTLRPNNSVVKASNVSKSKKNESIKHAQAQATEAETIQAEVTTDLLSASLPIAADVSSHMDAPKTPEHPVVQATPVIDQDVDVKEDPVDYVIEEHPQSIEVKDVQPAPEDTLPNVNDPAVEDITVNTLIESEESVIDFIGEASCIVNGKEESTSPHSQENLDAFYDDEDFEWGSMTADLLTEDPIAAETLLDHRQERLEISDYDKPSDALKTSVEVGAFVPQIASNFVNGMLTDCVLAKSLAKESQNDRNDCLSVDIDDNVRFREDRLPRRALIEKSEEVARLDAIMEEAEELHHPVMNIEAHVETEECLEDQKETPEDVLYEEEAIESHDSPPSPLDEYSESEEEVDRVQSPNNSLEDEKASNLAEEHVEEERRGIPIETHEVTASALALDCVNDFLESEEETDRIHCAGDTSKEKEASMEVVEGQNEDQQYVEDQIEISDAVGVESAIGSLEPPFAALDEVRDLSLEEEKMESREDVSIDEKAPIQIDEAAKEEMGVKVVSIEKDEPSTVDVDEGDLELEGEYDEQYDAVDDMKTDAEEVPKVEIVQAIEEAENIVIEPEADITDVMEELAQENDFDSEGDTNLNVDEGRREPKETIESEIEEDQKQIRDESKEMTVLKSVDDEVLEVDAMEMEERIDQNLMEIVISPFVSETDERHRLECSNLIQMIVQRIEQARVDPRPVKPLEFQVALPEVIDVIENAISVLSQSESVEATSVIENHEMINPYDESDNTLLSSDSEACVPPTIDEKADTELTSGLFRIEVDESPKVESVSAEVFIPSMETLQLVSTLRISDQKTRKENDQEESASAVDVVEYANEYDEGFEEDALEPTYEADDFVTDPIMQQSAEAPTNSPADEEEMYDDADNFE